LSEYSSTASLTLVRKDAPDREVILTFVAGQFSRNPAAPGAGWCTTRVPVPDDPGHLDRRLFPGGTQQSQGWSRWPSGIPVRGHMGHCADGAGFRHDGIWHPSCLIIETEDGTFLRHDQPQTCTKNNIFERQSQRHRRDRP
jgi:hypothetical protein